MQTKLWKAGKTIRTTRRTRNLMREVLFYIVGLIVLFGGIYLIELAFHVHRYGWGGK